MVEVTLHKGVSSLSPRSLSTYKRTVPVTRVLESRTSPVLDHVPPTTLDHLSHTKPTKPSETVLPTTTTPHRSTPFAHPCSYPELPLVHVGSLHKNPLHYVSRSNTLWTPTPTPPLHLSPVVEGVDEVETVVIKKGVTETCKVSKPEDSPGGKG